MNIGNDAVQSLASVPGLEDLKTDSYWHDVISELHSLAVALGHKDVLVLMAEDSDPRWEGADCVLVYGLLGSEQAKEAYFRLCFLRNERTIIFHRAPPHQHFGEQAIELTLAQLPSGEVVARVSDGELLPPELAAFFMSYLSSRLPMQ